MAAGDGLADLVGRRYGASNKWPGTDKSVAGSLAFWVGATVCSLFLLGWMEYCNMGMQVGLLTDNPTPVVLGVAGITAAAAILELIPFGDDNWTVPVGTAMLTTVWMESL